MKNLSQSNQNNLFYLQYTNASVVIKVIKNLRNDCSTGYKNVPVSFSKLVAPVAFILYNYIDCKTFPDQLHLPISKIQLPTSSADFRPISILPILSKVFERVILQQMSKFVFKKILYITNTNQATENTTEAQRR